MMYDFELCADGIYRICKDPDDVLPYELQWYDFLRGNDKYWAPRTFVRPGEVWTPTQSKINGHRYVASTGGVTGIKEPDWPVSVGGFFNENNITWTEIGTEDKIASATWNAGGLTATNEIVDSTGYVTSVTLAGLTAGQQYVVTNSIVSTRGKKKDQSFTVIVKQN